MIFFSNESILKGPQNWKKKFSKNVDFNLQPLVHTYVVALFERNAEIPGRQRLGPKNAFYGIITPGLW